MPLVEILNHKGYLESLSQNILFRNIETSEIINLLNKCEKLEVCRFESGRYIAWRGSVYHSLLLILEGKVQAEIHDFKGKVLKVESLKKSEIIASAVLFAPNPLLPVSLRAETDVSVLCIKKQDILSLLSHHPLVLQNYLKDNGLKICILAEKMNMLQFRTIREKIAAYMISQMRLQNTKDFIDLSITIEQLSEIFGVARPSLSRELTNFYDEGILIKKGHRIYINHPDVLEEIIHDF